MSHFVRARSWLPRPAGALARGLAATALAVTLAAAPPPATAQNLFAPVMQINDQVITEYEMQQWTQFAKLLNAPGDPRDVAKERLIEAKLQMDAAKRLNITVTSDQVVAGEEEFAGRANLDRDSFLKALAQGGVSEETFREFVRAGLLWREVIKQKFAPKVRISDKDVDEALSATAPRSDAVQVLYSEIILPANTPQAKAEAERRAAEITQYTSIDQFSRAARAFSAAPSRDRGGRVNWVKVQDLPPGLGGILLQLSPGEVTQPLPIPNAIALLQLRDIRDGVAPPPTPLTVEYAIYPIPGGRSADALAEAGRVIAASDNCDDLYEMARKTGRIDQVVRETQDMAEVPSDIGLELAKLDPGETSTALTRGGNLALLMLCSRQVPLPEGTTRDDIRQRIGNERIASYGQGYMEELKADAIIRLP